MQTGKAAALKGFELPKAIHLDHHPFSVEADLITPKLSLKRPQLLKHYKTQVGHFPGRRGRPENGMQI